MHPLLIAFLIILSIATTYAIIRPYYEWYFLDPEEPEGIPIATAVHALRKHAPPADEAPTKSLTLKDYGLGPTVDLRSRVTRKDKEL